jgi:hypothetical protein
MTVPGVDEWTIAKRGAFGEMVWESAPVVERSGRRS